MKKEKTIDDFQSSQQHICKNTGTSLLKQEITKSESYDWHEDKQILKFLALRNAALAHKAMIVAQFLVPSQQIRLQI